MVISELRKINKFKVIDDHGIEYTLEEYRNVTETRTLKWITVLPSWFELADGTPVDKIDDQTFRITTNDTLLHRHTG